MFFVKVIIILSLVFVVFDSKKNDKDINVICVYINFI